MCYSWQKIRLSRFIIPFILAVVACASTDALTEEPEKPAGIVIYPIDRAAIMAGTRFDLKIEFPTVIREIDIKATVNGRNLKLVFGRDFDFTEKELDQLNRPASSVILRDCVLKEPGVYVVCAGAGKADATVTWNVFAPPSNRTAKNVILMIGDGMSQAHRTAARILSKGIKEGKYNGNLAMDSMPHMALVGTSGVDSLVTDSANSATAYTTGHKSSNGALGVYADRTPDPQDDPQTENLASLVRRMRQMAVGVVSDAEIQDATPAAMYAHTRKRSDFANITRMLWEAPPEVVLGGGAANFTPPPYGVRKDGVSYLQLFRGYGYTVVRTREELLAAGRKAPSKLLGLFNASNIDGVLDRKFLHKGTTAEFPDQPDLTEMAAAALNVLSRHDAGFVLMIEGARIDKYSHVMDWERAVMDTIMFDKTVALVKDFAEARNDTLVLVLADHTHGISIAGTIDDNSTDKLPARIGSDGAGTGTADPEQQGNSATRWPMRDKVKVNEQAGYPNYEDKDGDGYPDSLNVSRRLAVFFTAFPNHYETYRPKLDGPFEPTEKDGLAIRANTKYKDEPGAELRIGNIPRWVAGEPHSAEDVIVTATGPGSEQVHGFMDNTEIFRIMVNALGLKD